MIDSMQKDLNLWKQASQIRELCEKMESKKLRSRKLWLAMSGVAFSLFLLLKFVLPANSALYAEMTGNPVLIQVLISVGLLIVAVTFYVFMACSSASAKADKARKEEWKALRLANRRFHQVA